MPTEPWPGYDNQPVSTVTTKNSIGLQSATFNPNDPREYINPPADPRLNDIVSRTAPTLSQGIIQQTDDNVSGDQKTAFACRFMFNPTVVSVSYQAIEGITPPSELTSDAAKGMAAYPGSTNINFTLLFDRTFEVFYGPRGKGVKDLRDLGCYVDIAALETVVGARIPFSAKGGAKPPIMQGMQYRPVYVIFGGGSPGHGQSGIAGLTYLGYITAMTVTYTHFSTRMVPVRATVDLSVQQQNGPDPFGFKAKGGTIIERYAALRTTTASRSLVDKSNTLGINAKVR